MANGPLPSLDSIPPHPVLKQAIDQHGPDHRATYDAFITHSDDTPARKAAIAYREKCRAAQPSLV